MNTEQALEQIFDRLDSLEKKQEFDRDAADKARVRIFKRLDVIEKILENIPKPEIKPKSKKVEENDDN